MIFNTASKFILVVIFISFLMFSCRDKESNSGKNTTVTTTNKEDSYARDTTEIRQTILSFYNWYVANYEKLGEFKLYGPDTPPYKMNWPEVKRMQDFIRASVPQLGEAFLKNQEIFLKQSDSAFKADPKDEMPYGFDFDWYTNSQEDPKYLLDEINKSGKWIYTIHDSTAIADIRGKWLDNGKEAESTLIKLGLSREKGNWKIARIGIE